ncbi:Rrf2 family transcriptional regulator [Alkalibacter rhizosphaerae]|uniref:Rrf2 family transcriptional regulator n=1 Tax=Alkalibacter rhizosphaerae TaxID=2815577 RepID=A0A974XD52_9FIRM|nr:Rrf2 family transcriptional regulator [Alkalibacter rhizosphaerae]QSX07526.1 Rrf2 family transcriptional regulator [Alkalibacter rhizosphaerae]
MKISTKGRYALEAVVDLAHNSKEELESLKNVAQRLGKSKNYLEQLFVQLRKAGVVVSVRGAQGGYRLAKNPEDFTVGDIVRPVEGSLLPVHCLEDDGKCPNKEVCPTMQVWGKVGMEINRVMDQITLQDLLVCYEGSMTDVELEYYI